MTTAVDANILLDALGGDEAMSDRAFELLRKCRGEGQLVVSLVTYAEIAHRVVSRHRVDKFLDELGIATTDLTREGAHLAGQLFRAYRARGGKRDRILADFLVGAHAMTSADRLLSADHGFRGTAFPGLTVVIPD